MKSFGSSVLIVLLALSSCAPVKTARMEKSEGLSATCTPGVLEVVGDTIRATVVIDFPAGYLHPSEKIAVTPAVVYAGGQSSSATSVFQGTDVRENYHVIPAGGARVSIPVVIPFRKGMEQSYLELRLNATAGRRTVALPAIKVADGCVATVLLADAPGEYDLKPDGYRETVRFSWTMNLKYAAGSSVIERTRHNKAAIEDTKRYVSNIISDPKASLTGASILSFASPEGGAEYNASLSKRRSSSATDAWADIAGEDASVSVRSLGQDWEGLRRELQGSDVEDKDLIIRVLDMYQDPEVREREIRNMARLYSQLDEMVFPELRRSTVVVEGQYANLTTEELRQKAVTMLFLMSEEELLRLATITEDKEQRETYYKMAASRYNSVTAGYNLAVQAIGDGQDGLAKAYLAKIRKPDADVLNAFGVLALREGDNAAALDFFSRSESACARRNAGALLLALGDYPGAASALAGTSCFNEALSLVLCGRLSEARAVLDTGTARGAYLRAVIAAREGDSDSVREWLSKASASEEYRAMAARDCEFLGYR